MIDEWSDFTPKMPPKPTVTLPWLMGMIAILSVLYIVVPQPTCRLGEPARRAQCINNLKQIGLAIQNYHEEGGVYPPGNLANPNLPTEKRLSWMYSLVPFIDSFPRLAIPEEPDKAWDDPIFATSVSSPLFCASCPSNRDRKSANFVGIAGLGIDSPGLPKNHRRAGFFGDDRVVTESDLKDGAANTMIVAESNRKAGPWLAGGRATVRGLDPATRPYLGQGGQFGSFHSRGSNVLMADGSVRFIKDSVDPKILEASSTIAGGENGDVFENNY